MKLFAVFHIICVAPNYLIINKMMGILPRLWQGEGCAHLAVNQHLTRHALPKKPRHARPKYPTTRPQKPRHALPSAPPCAQNSPATAGKGPAAPSGKE